MFSLTFSICAIIVLLATYAAIVFEIKLKKLFTDTKGFNGTLPYSGNGALKRVFDEYSKTFKSPNYTTEYAGDYISTETVAASYGINLKLVATVPNLLTSFGILGTFLGLTVSLSQFDSETSEAIRSSINSLLGGMSTAFITSVFGMAASMVFLVYQKKRINTIDNTIGKLVSSLDEQFHASEDQVLLDAFSYTAADGSRVTPGQSFSSMQSSLANFGTELKQNIAEAMGNSFDEKVVPVINDLATRLENPAQAVIDSLVKELGAICNTFSTTLTQSVNDQLDELLERFIDASNAIQQIPESVETITTANKEISAALDEQVIKFTDLSESLSDNLKGIMDSVDKITSMQNEIADMPDTLKAAADTISDSTHTLANTNEAISTKIEEQMSNLVSAGQTTTQIVNDYSTNIQAIQDGLKNIFADITAGLSQYAAATRDGLQQMLDPFSTSITDATERVANSIAPLGDAVNELSTFGDTVRQTLKDLEIALSPITKSIDELSKQAQELGKNQSIVLEKVNVKQ